MRRRLEQPAQARSGGELAGLDDDQRVAHRRLEKRRQRVGVAIAGVAKPDHAAAADHGQRRRLVGQARRVLSQRRAGDVAHPERVGEVVDHAARQRLGALAHQAAVGAIEQHRADARVGTVDESLGLTGADFHCAGAGAGTSDGGGDGAGAGAGTSDGDGAGAGSGGCSKQVSRRLKHTDRRSATSSATIRETRSRAFFSEAIVAKSEATML